METQLSECLDTSRMDMEKYPTPEQQRDIIKEIEKDATTYSYFVCKSWYHQWKAHVCYDDLRPNCTDHIITQQPREKTDNDLAHPVLISTANQIQSGTNSNSYTQDLEHSDEQSSPPIMSTSTPIKHNNNDQPKSQQPASVDTTPSPKRNKPKLTRVCKNSSKTELDSSFEISDKVEFETNEKVRPINPTLAGLKAESRKEGEKPEANTSISDIFEQAKERQGQLPHPGSAVLVTSLDEDPEDRRGSVDKHVTFSMKPGPIEFDTENDQNNILVNENVWAKLVQWYDISESHDLGRAFSNADKNCFEEFGVSLLSPVMTFIQRPVKSFNIRDEVGYIEVQVRKILQIPGQKCTRLWIREKDQKSKFQPLLQRTKSLGVYQEELKCDLSCILALEVLGLDGIWPSGAPGTPVGRLDKYSSLTGRQNTLLSWERQLEDAIQDIIACTPTNHLELTSALTATTRHIIEAAKLDMEKSKETMEAEAADFHCMAESLKCKLVTVKEKDNRLTADLEAIKTREAELLSAKTAFEEQIAEMKNINKIQDTQVKLNVGGQQFVTSLSTLTSDPNSLLGTMFSGIHPMKQDNSGSYFIDRDSCHFRFIINFLREGSCSGPTALPADENTLSELLAEAKYYRISGLIEFIQEKMKHEGFNPNSETTSHVPERTPSKIPLRRLYEKGQSISSDPIL